MVWIIIQKVPPFTWKQHVPYNIYKNWISQIMFFCYLKYSLKDIVNSLKYIFVLNNTKYTRWLNHWKSLWFLIFVYKLVNPWYWYFHKPILKSGALPRYFVASNVRFLGTYARFCRPLCPISWDPRQAAKCQYPGSKALRQYLLYYWTTGCANQILASTRSGNSSSFLVEHSSEQLQHVLEKIFQA